MFTFQGNVDFAIGRYQEGVRLGEWRAVRIAEDEPGAAAGGKWYRQAHLWWTALWVNRERSLFQPLARIRHSEQPAG